MGMKFTPLESEIQATCLTWLEAWGAVAVRTNSGAIKIGKRFIRFNKKKGCSDALVCLVGGRFAAVEFKRPGNDATGQQSKFLGDVAEAGGLALVVTSLDDLRTQLVSAGYDTEIRL